MNQLITQYADTSNYFLEIDAIKTKIDAAVQADPYHSMDYGWSYNDYSHSYTEALGAHVKYGLKPYIIARINSIKNQLVLNPIAPIISNVYHNFPSPAESAVLKATIVDDEPDVAAILYYHFNSEAIQNTSMVSKGNGLYTASLPPIGQPGTIYYFIVATDASQKTTREPNTGEYSMKIATSSTTLCINEFMASNTNGIVDNHGQTADWIEIKNTGTQTISLKNKYATDDLADKTKWELPDISLAPGNFYLIWADNDPKQGPNHAGFKLDKTGETLAIFDSFEANYALIDSYTFTTQTDNVSFGKNNLNQMVSQAFITPGGENESPTVSYLTFNYNMNQQITEGNFNPETDFIDIAGTFNNWNGGERVYDGDNDGIYSITLLGFVSGDQIEYKARINASWATAEFPELGWAGNRKYKLIAGENTVSHWYNDQESSVTQIKIPDELAVYPNPSTCGAYFTIQSNYPINKIAISNLNGNLVFQDTPFVNVFQVNQQFEPGIYILQVISNNRTLNSKIIIQ